jgi:hypothetical protein
LQVPSTVLVVPSGTVFDVVHLTTPPRTLDLALMPFFPLRVFLVLTLVVFIYCKVQRQ